MSRASAKVTVKTQDPLASENRFHRKDLPGHPQRDNTAKPDESLAARKGAKCSLRNPYLQQNPLRG